MVSTVGARYVSGSLTDKLPPGTKISDLFARSMAGETIVQRVGEAAYWVHARHYNTVFAVGSRGVLLMDAPDGLFDPITAAVARVTDLPVTAVVLSHLHADHVGDTARYQEAARAAGVPFRVLATRQTEAKMIAINSVIPRPTDVLDWPSGGTEVDGIPLSVSGFEWAAHTDDHSVWMLPGQGVAHAPDLLFPDQPPFWRLGGNERYLFYRSNLQDAGELDWDVLSGGHGNLGERADLEFQLRFLTELEEAVADAIRRNDFFQFVDPALGNHTSFLTRFMAAVTEDATAQLRPRYGRMYGFEVATPANAEMVAFSQFANR